MRGSRCLNLVGKEPREVSNFIFPCALRSGRVAVVEGQFAQQADITIRKNPNIEFWTAGSVLLRLKKVAVNCSRQVKEIKLFGRVNQRRGLISQVN